MMCNTGFNHWQTGSNGLFLVGGKVVFGGGWKFGNQEVGQWLLYGHWPLFDQVISRVKISYCKSFEDNTYNDKKNGQVAWRCSSLRRQK